MTRTHRLLVLDIAIVLLYALFLCAPPFFASPNAQNIPATLTWLALPIALAHHRVPLSSATLIVTVSALLAAALGALLSISARMRGSSALWAAGAWLFGCSVAILMPLWTAVGFLGALLLLLALRARFVAMPRSGAMTAVLSEIWPIGYAAGFAVLAWRYNPQLLLKALLIALGAALVARAFVPAPTPEMTT